MASSRLFVRRLLEAHLLEAERRIQEALRVMDSNPLVVPYLRVPLTRAKQDIREVLKEVEGEDPPSKE
jgi:hypothetical protein